jgi:hypothetical protein
LIRWSDDGAIVLAARPIASFLGLRGGADFDGEIELAGGVAN